MIMDSPFTGCCGTYILHNFYSGPERTEQYRNHIKNLKKEYSNRAFLVAVLNKTQERHHGKMLREEGFRCVALGNNKPHPRTQPLRLYVYANPMPKKRKKNKNQLTYSTNIVELFQAR